MKHLIALILLTAFFFTGIAQSEETGKALKKGQIEALVKGNTAEGVKTREVISSAYEDVTIRFQTFYRDDGVVIQRGAGAGDKHGTTAVGKWWVKKHALCYQYPQALRERGEICRKVVPVGNGAYELQTGKGETRQIWNRVVEGNPHKL